jgi:threonine dehydrogenase-like Zn-dependent dehydrogenase
VRGVVHSESVAHRAEVRSDLRSDAAAQPSPPLAPGEVTIAITRAILSPDDAIAFPALAPSPAPGFPRVFGHAGVGRVIAAGPPTRPGGPDPARLMNARVALHPIIACARCERCRAGLSSHCVRRAALGCWDAALALFSVTPRPGVLQERITVPAFAIEAIPANVSDEAASLAPTIAGALQVARAVRVEHKPYVTILGDGAIALLVAQHLARLNASVRVLGKHPHRLALCERWGIKHRDAREVGLRQDQDVVIDATGRPDTLEFAQRLLRPRGRLIVKAPLWPRATKPASLAWAADAEAEVTFVGASPLRDALDALQHAEFDVAPFLAPRVTLDSVPGALATLRERAALRVLVDVQS